jgi:alpha-tubulin suppressor-like RCC1 family protein
MAVVTLGKVKFVHRGAYVPATTYSKGDIVTFEDRLYIYKNDVPKAHAPIVLPTLNGSIASLGIQTSIVTVTFTGFNPQTQTAGIVTSYYPEAPKGPWNQSPRTGLRLYSKHFDTYAGITSIGTVTSTTAVLYLTSVGLNTAVVTNDPIVLGPRRMMGQYEIATNEVDWDLYSDGTAHVGTWSQRTTYYPGDIVKRRNSSYICGVGHSNVDPLFDHLGAWEVFSRGDDLMPSDRCLGFVNNQPFGWKGHPYILGPQWGTVNRWNGNIPWNTSLGIGSTSVHAWRWNPGWNKGHMSYRNSEQFINGEGVIMAESGTSNAYMHSDGGAHIEAQENDVPYHIDFNSGEWANFGNNPFHMTRRTPRIIQSMQAWNDNRWHLTSDGGVHVSGQSNHGRDGYSNDDGQATQAAFTIPRKAFKNRSIVKLVTGGHQSRDGDAHCIALDEYGEIHCWGRNDTGQCGISSDSGTTSGSGNSPDIYYFEDNGMGVNNRAWLIHTMNKDFFFGGNRIVDIWAGHRTSYALDEAGNLWSWGYNHQGQLMYPTNSGFRDSDRSYTPLKVPVNWNTYGGIQKLVVASSENLYTIALLDGQGYVWTCGYNGYGQLGDGTTTNNSNSSTITRRTSWTGAAQIVNVWVDIDDGGYGHIWYRTQNGNTYGVGYDGHYNLTTGSAPSSRTSPNIILGPGNTSTQALTNIVCMSSAGRSGGTTQHFLDQKGYVYATGWNGYGVGGIGRDSTIANNNARHQQNGQSQYAVARKIHAPYYMANPMTAYDSHPWGGSACIDISSTGDYEGTLGVNHNVRSQTLFDNGEVMQTGRNYDWGFASYRGTVYGTVPSLNWAG